MIMAREHGSIKGAVVNETFRVVLFLVYYLALICLGIAILVAAFYVAKFLGEEVLPNAKGRGVIGVIVVIAGVLSLAGVFGIYLIKPLFSFTKSTNEERVEVKEGDCPKLFGLIRRLSERTGFRMPRHVYLTTDVNACVFYNTGFWSIFLPVRKNLEIGLGIFNATTIQEVKAVLAHEFGHFGQSSMKVGSAVSVTNKVLYNLIYTDDFFDNALYSWRNAGWYLWRLFGMLAYGMTMLVKLMTIHVFAFVQIGERRLSRLMEFGADEVACRCAGSDAFVSAMCKIKLLDACDMDWLRSFLRKYLNENKLPDNYFKAHDAVVKALSKEGWPTLSHDVQLKNDYDFGVAESRVEIKDVWSTHPELADRLACARELALACGDEESDPAWTLIPEELAQKVSDRFFQCCVADMDKKPEIVSSTEFQAFVDKWYAENGFPLEFSPFFARSLEKFDLQKAFEADVKENPFTAEYRRLVGELNMAKSDMETLEQVASGEIEAKKFLYNGTAYTKKTAPVAQHREYLEGLAAAVAKCDSAACSYLTHIGNGADRSYVKTMYGNMMSMKALCSQLAERLLPHEEFIDRCLTNCENLSADKYHELCARIVMHEKEFRQGIAEVQRMLPDAIPDDESGRRMLEYASKAHNCESDFALELFQELQGYRNAFGSMCGNYSLRCKLAIARFADARINKD